MDLVTGATGHLGNTLVKKLLKSGRKVRVFLRKESDPISLSGLDIQKSYGDIQDFSSVMEACRNIETVYHTAAEISIMPSGYKHLDRVNCKGTENIISACFENKVQKLIYTSSIQALAGTCGESGLDEKACFMPEKCCSGYNRTKAAASCGVLQAAKQGLHTVVLCPTAFIGPYDYKISLIGQFLIDYLQERLSFIIDGAFDFVDIRDVANAHIAASQKAGAGQYYIISGHQIDMRKLINILYNMTGKRKPRYWLGNSLAGLTAYFTTFYYWLTGTKPQFTRYSLATLKSNSLFSHQKAARELGYRPRPFEKSLQDSIEWYKKIANLFPADP